MKIAKENINFNDALLYADYNDLLLKRRDNGMLLSDYQIDVLSKNGIDFNKCNNLHDLLFNINLVLESNYQKDLDLVGSQISEILYYSETKK